ncbi:MAG: MMPL family transporter [Acidobacteria bacterium]|nr:MMPL family transporter [Acidobacteriota bacterium]
MKSLVRGLASAVRRVPWVVVGVTVVLTMVFGSLASQFLPAEDQNEAFAPNAPELSASTFISETFGSVASMQVLTSSSTGDVITLDALNAVFALDESVRASDAAQYLADSQEFSAVLSHLAPVQFALQAGAEYPTSDSEVKALYVGGFGELPVEFQAFMTALVSEDANFETATAEYGLTAISYVSSDDFDESARRAVAVADAVSIAQTSESIAMDPFSQELIFGSSDDFQQEILRLFASAGLIILLVLASVFMVRTGSVRDRGLFVVGIVLMVIGASISIAPGLALLFPDVLPASWADAGLGPVLLTALMFYVAAFLLWTVGSRRIRRTVADTLLTFLTIGLVIQWMNGYGYLRFEEQSQMVQILPILLIGLGVDYAIHMTSRYRQELHDGKTVDAAISTAIRTVGVALVLATLTTAVGFLTNITNDLPALAEFGELAAVGIAFSFLLMLTFMPAVRELLDRRAERHHRLDTDGLAVGEARALPKIVGRAAVLPQKFAAVTIVVALLFTGLGAYAMTGLSTKFSFLDFVPTTSPLRDTAITLSDRFDFPESTSVLVSGDVATGAAWNTMFESYSAAPAISHVRSIDVPGVGEFPTGTSFIGVMLALMDPDGEMHDVATAAAAADAGFGQDRTFPSNADLTLVYDAAVASQSVVMDGVLAADESGYSAALFRFDTVAGEESAANLAEDLNSVFSGGQQAGLESVATSSFIISDLVVTSLRDSQLSSLLLTLGAAFLLLVINFWFELRRPMLGLITTVPVAMVVVWTFGIMATLNIPFGPVTAMISAIGIGIGIPYMIHVTHRYLEERLEQPNEDAAIAHTLTHTGGALGGSAITTVLGFGILMTSTTIPFRQFGFVLAYTILLAFLAAVLVLPSMLIVWDRWHRSRGDAVLDAVDSNVVIGE